MKISQEKKDKIFEQILALLFNSSPKMIFTSHIAKELARDEEFTKKLLQELKKKNLVLEIKKNSNGKEYLKRSRWKLSENVYNLYRFKQK
jgi:hypothetical protein